VTELYKLSPICWLGHRRHPPIILWLSFGCHILLLYKPQTFVYSFIVGHIVLTHKLVLLYSFTIYSTYYVWIELYSLIAFRYRIGSLFTRRYPAVFLIDRIGGGRWWLESSSSPKFDRSELEREKIRNLLHPRETYILSRLPFISRRTVDCRAFLLLSH
jgi:hypothetical protein